MGVKDLKCDARERDLRLYIAFAFNEYECLQSPYPVHELAMTGYLFGSIIPNHVIDYSALKFAIFSIPSIAPPGTNLFTFGIEALMQFESRLPEWPPLVKTLL